MASQNFEENFICWKETGNILTAIKKPNILVSWNLDTGNIISYKPVEQFNFSNYRKHTDWNGMTLLKQIKEVKIKLQKPADGVTNTRQTEPDRIHTVEFMDEDSLSEDDDDEQYE